MLETEAALESALRSSLFKEQTVWLLQRPGRGNERPTHRGERTDSLCRGEGGGRLIWAERPTHAVCLRHVQAWVQMCDGESVRERKKWKCVRKCDSQSWKKKKVNQKKDNSFSNSGVVIPPSLWCVTVHTWHLDNEDLFYPVLPYSFIVGTIKCWDSSILNSF